MSYMDLSPRQKEIVAVMAGRDITYQEAAEELGMSPNTLKNHAQRIGSLMAMTPKAAIEEYARTQTVPAPPPEPAHPPEDLTDPHDDPTPTEFGGVTLTKRQLQVAELVAQGYVYKNIGRLLGGISEKTISVHVQDICRAAGRTGNIGARAFVTRWYHDVTARAKVHGDGPSVYFIRATNGLIKIGTSTNPAGRLAALQAASPVDLRLLGTCPGDHRVEAELHAKFWDHRTRGEWFEPSEKLEAEIQRLISGDAEDAA